MTETKHQTTLRDIALFCLTQYAGIQSPAENRKHPQIHYLKYQIRECPKHGLRLTSTLVSAAKRKRCDEQMLTRHKTSYSGAPRTAWCKEVTEVIEELGKEDIGYTTGETA